MVWTCVANDVSTSSLFSWSQPPVKILTREIQKHFRALKFPWILYATHTQKKRMLEFERSASKLYPCWSVLCSKESLQLYFVATPQQSEDLINVFKDLHWIKDRIEEITDFQDKKCPKTSMLDRKDGMKPRMTPDPGTSRHGTASLTTEGAEFWIKATPP